MLLANSPSLNPRCNFFNICALWNHFAKALKNIPCPQSAVTGWVGGCSNVTGDVHLDRPQSIPSQHHPGNYNTSIPQQIQSWRCVLVPYTPKEKSTIDARFAMVKNYFETWKNIYQACYDTLDEHVNNAFKVAPPTTPPTTGWNSTMIMHDIFDQLATACGKPTPDTMHQNNVTFLAVYNP